MEFGYLYMGKADRQGGTTRGHGLNLSLVGSFPVAQSFRDADFSELFYKPSTEQNLFPVWHQSAVSRLTTQINQKNKVNVYTDWQYTFFGNCFVPTYLTAISACPEYKNIPQYILQASWSSPLTNKILLEAGGMDESFFIYLEDMELGLRLRSLGHCLTLEPGVGDDPLGAGGLADAGVGVAERLRARDRAARDARGDEHQPQGDRGLGPLGRGAGDPLNEA